MATNYLGNWVMTAQNGTPEYGWNGGSVFRETETRIYEINVTATSTIPDTPVNPANLSPVGWRQVGIGVWTRVDSWVCMDRGFDRDYESPAPKKYHETWQKVGAWKKEGQ